MLRVSHVIWLPRSRADARGEYQYRIWYCGAANEPRPVTPWLLSPSGGATGATLASHFRRLRVCSRPWVLVGRRCTFEAMIVHLRRLPVTAAGHDLDIIQSKLVSEGSMLLSWPWTGHWRGFAQSWWQGLVPVATEIDDLGKVNGAFFVALTLVRSPCRRQLCSFLA